MLPVQRVTINVDHDWDTDFIPWLEDKEKKIIGVEDGVFVATVDPGLRVLQPEREGLFIMHCIQNKLSAVSTLALQEYDQKGIFLFSSNERRDLMEEFKETLCHLHSYKTDTCCSSILKQCDNLENVVNHLFDVSNTNVEKGCTSRSRVLLEECGLKVEELYNKYSKNTEGFLWEKMQSAPPVTCPQPECYLKDDEIEVGDGKSRAYDRPTKKSKLILKSLEQNDAVPCYGYGYESPADTLNITAKLNMSRIFNILWLIPHHYPGLHSPYLYFGTTHSFFPVHVEDALTLSLNYLHIGHPKVWVIIPPWATELLEFHLQKCCILLYHTSCRNILGHKSVLPTLCWLKERKIPFKIVIQQTGDLVVLYPSAAHFGFNTGPNIAQAINIATKSWIPWGLNAKKCRCLLNQVHLDMSPFVAAFKKDLLSHTMHGRVVLTPQMLRGMQLVRDEVVKSCTVWEDKEPCQGNHGQEFVTFKCPVEKCEKTFIHTPVKNARTNMIKHVKSTHRPLIDKYQLLVKIDQVLNPVCKK